ncbi:cytochrome P450 [Melanogaster broomeanus]|nr:cytochrome P450 [Melanogaster broomeanus]
MRLHVPELPDSVSGAFYILAGIVSTAFVIARLSKRTKLDAIPTAGSSTWLGSWWAGVKFMFNGTDVIQEGYKKYKAVPFKVATLTGWMVIVSGRQCYEDILSVPDDVLSIMEALNDILKTEYTLGYAIHHNPYHFSIIRLQLTRNLGILYTDIRDEIVAAFDDTLDLQGNEWKNMPAFDAILKVICRTSNRVFVGLPLCRDPDWMDLTIKFTLDVVKGGIVVGLFPRFLAPIVAQFMTSVPGSTKRAMEHLRPIIEERQKYFDEYGIAWADKPNDILSWLIDVAEGSERTIKSLTLRILSVNFSAIHTSSNIFTQALFRLAANPQYVQPLREEVESIVETEGWSKASLVKMRKIDSFLRESQRMEGMGSASIARKAMKDFTFSDGTVIPKGTIIGMATLATHLDNEIYEHPGVFDPFRFADMPEEDGDGAKHQLVSTDHKYLAFGHGKHVCPGRFFAANELKTMLAHIVVSYDIKLESGATLPQSLRVGAAIAAHPSAKVMFRKRVH